MPSQHKDCTLCIAETESTGVSNDKNKDIQCPRYIDPSHDKTLDPSEFKLLHHTQNM